MINTSNKPLIEYNNTLQFNPDGHLKHLLDIKGLTKTEIQKIFTKTDLLLRQPPTNQPLKHKTLINLFYEASTRTRISFELAAKRLGADVVNIQSNASSVSKGESLSDTFYTLQAMQPDLLVIRHPNEGTAHLLAQEALPQTHIINAGDGSHAHPTQALLDSYTIRQYKHNFTNLCVAIIGDIKYSRAVRSLIQALRILETGEIRACGPQTLIPDDIAQQGVMLFKTTDACLEQADVVVTLRIQKERIHPALLPDEQEYFQHYGIDNRRLQRAKADAIVMHPGPINRGIEITSEVADGPQSVIREQVKNGLAVRMAVITELLDNRI